LTALRKRLGTRSLTALARRFMLGLLFVIAVACTPPQPTPAASSSTVAVTAPQPTATGPSPAQAGIAATPAPPATSAAATLAGVAAPALAGTSASATQAVATVPTPPPGAATPLPGAATPLPGAATPPPGAATPPPGAATSLPSAATPPPSAATPLPGAATPPPGAATLPPGAATPTAAAEANAVTGDVVVFAASSLTDAFKEIAAAFRQLHPGARVVLSFGGSSQLATQLINGARADVFASADQDQMDQAERGHALVGEQHVFVQNRLMVITPADNPAHVTSLADLARGGVKVIGAQASVPIGYYTSTLLRSASADPTYGADFQRRVEQNVVSREDTVRQIVAKIQLGEADAAVVYTTDVSPGIEAQFVRIPLPDELQVVAIYPIAVTSGHNRPGGEAFVDFVQSPPAQAILEKWGFIREGSPV
jgi:molybdate transport system substrate-binding protein